MISRLSIGKEIELARAILSHSIDFIRNPPDGITEDPLRAALSDCLLLSIEVERVEDLAQSYNLRKDRRIDTAVKIARPRSYHNHYSLITNAFERMVGFRRRLEAKPWLKTRKASRQTFDDIMAHDIIDACFDAALTCEARYEKGLQSVTACVDKGVSAF